MSTKKRHNEVVFKPYIQNQGWLFPPSLGDLIPQDHKVRLVNDAIDGMNIDTILSTYKGGGTSSYHPKMLLKVLVYGYIEKIYSSRGIEKALQENVCFMWLSGMQQPDHNTLNTFRRHRLNQTVKQVFAQVLLLLIEQGYVRMKDYHVDGTKMESVANRYTFVWAKNVERYKNSLLDKIALLIAQIEQTNEKEEALAKQVSGPQEEVLHSHEDKITDSEALQKTIVRINEELNNSSESEKVLKKKRTKVKKLAEQHLEKLRDYERQELLLNGRSSYSKTDTDATFMRTKEDHLGTGQLKPCYNIQLGTEDQFIVNYTVHQTASDMSSFITHMDDTIELLNQIEASLPENAVADAGYGSEENYEYLAAKGIEAYVKYPGFYKERKGKFKYPFDMRTLYYNEQEDYFVCPMGQHMHRIKDFKKKTSKGKEQTITQYGGTNCSNCPLRTRCFKKKGNRIIEVNHKSRAYRKSARQRLETLKGLRKRKKRNVDTEPVFGHIKYNRGFRRFMLTTSQGVCIETGLLAIAHNFTKWHLQGQCRRRSLPSPKHPMAQIMQLPTIQANYLIKTG